jgi:hypothetical protein
MCVEHPEKRFDVVGRLRDFESVRVTVLVTESNFELELAGHEMERAQPDEKLLEKPAKHEQERLARFDFVLELERFFERFADRDELQQASGFSGGAFPKLDANRSEAGRHVFFLESGKLA